MEYEIRQREVWVAEPPSPEDCARAWLDVKSREVARPGILARFICVFKSYKQVLDADRNIWVYDQFLGRVFNFKETGWRQISHSDYEKAFGIEE